MDIEHLLSLEELEPIVLEMPEIGYNLHRTIEQIGDDLAVFPSSQMSGEPSDDGVPSRRMVHYWPRFKEEMRILICTDDKRYASVRKELTTVGTKSQALILSMISAALAPHVGPIAGVVVPLCGISLVAIAKVGRGAFCRGDELNIRIDK